MANMKYGKKPKASAGYSSTGGKSNEGVPESRITKYDKKVYMKVKMHKRKGRSGRMKY